MLTWRPCSAPRSRAGTTGSWVRHLAGHLACWSTCSSTASAETSSRRPPATDTRRLRLHLRHLPGALRGDLRAPARCAHRRHRDRPEGLTCCSTSSSSSRPSCSASASTA
jgi:hypothetical protein